MVVKVSGSIKAASGTMALLPITIFKFCGKSLITANWETSAELPVVGTQMRGGMGQLIRSIPFIIQNMPVVGANDAYAFGTVNRAASSNRDDYIAVFRAEDFRPQHNFFDSGIGADGIVNEEWYPGRCQTGLYVFYPSGRHYPRITDQQYLSGPQIVGISARHVTGPGAKHNFGNNELAQFIIIWRTHQKSNSPTILYGYISTILYRYISTLFIIFPAWGEKLTHVTTGLNELV
jgi:hypothetical protein